MKFSTIDRAVRISLLVLAVGAIALLGSLGIMGLTTTSEALRTTNLIVDNFEGVGTTTPAQQLDVSSSGRFCSGADHSCLPVQITEYFAAAPSVTFRRAEGTAAAPTPLTFIGEGLLQLRAQGYTSQPGFVGLPQVTLEVMTSEVPTATAQGNYLQLRTVTNGTNISKAGLKIDQNQNVAVGDDPFDAETVPYAFTQIGSIGFAAIIQSAVIVGGTVNDYAPTDTLGSGRDLDHTFYIRQFCSGTVTITGIAGGVGTTSVGTLGGRLVAFENTGSGTCTFTNQDTGSVIGNRIILPYSASLEVPTGGVVYFYYDQVIGRWKVLSASGGVQNFSTKLTVASGSARNQKIDASAAPSADHGTLSADASNFKGRVTGVGTNTTVTLTLAGGGYANIAHCMATPLAGTYITPGYLIVVTASKTAPIFNCVQSSSGIGTLGNCPDFEYECWGN